MDKSKIANILTGAIPLAIVVLILALPQSHITNNLQSPPEQFTFEITFTNNDTFPHHFAYTLFTNNTTKVAQEVGILVEGGGQRVVIFNLSGRYYLWNTHLILQDELGGLKEYNILLDHPRNIFELTLENHRKL